jgi:uncharacterized protein (DUF433 family)
MSKREFRSPAVTQELDVDALLGVGLYTISDSARIVSQALDLHVTRTNLTRWAFGRKSIIKDYAPIITPHLKINDGYLFTFADLIELFTIAALRQHNLPMSTVKFAYKRALEKYGSHPFAKHRFSIDGSGVFADADMEELSTGRVAFEEIVRPLLQNVSYTEDIAAMFSPLGTSRSVVLDPERSFGAPINKDAGIPTAVLAGMVSSGEEIDRVADWYGVSIQGVRDAVEYEKLLKAA